MVVPPRGELINSPVRGGSIPLGHHNAVKCMRIFRSAPIWRCFNPSAASNTYGWEEQQAPEPIGGWLAAEAASDWIQSAQWTGQHARWI